MQIRMIGTKSSVRNKVPRLWIKYILSNPRASKLAFTGSAGSIPNQPSKGSPISKKSNAAIKKIYLKMTAAFAGIAIANRGSITMIC